jgi:hypothetical protein
MFAVDDIDDVVARLRSHSAELVGEIAQYMTATGSASCVALRPRSLDWPSSSADTSTSRLAAPDLSLAKVYHVGQDRLRNGKVRGEADRSLGEIEAVEPITDVLDRRSAEREDAPMLRCFCDALNPGADVRRR